jgi:hypothetical protein
LAHGGTRTSADQDVSFDAQASMLAALCQTIALPAHDKWAAATFLASLLGLTAQPAKRTPHKAAAVRPLPHAVSDNYSFAVPPKNLVPRCMCRLAVQGAEFDKAYVANEVAYHKAVDSALETLLIPSATNAELK